MLRKDRDDCSAEYMATHQDVVVVVAKRLKEVAISVPPKKFHIFKLGKNKFKYMNDHRKV